MQIEDSYPLTPIQHGMLVHSLSAPQSGVYIQQLVSVLREKLNLSAFQRAWEQVLRRHPALRTSFFWENTEQPVQRVHRDVVLPLQNLDWRDRDLDDQENQLERFLQSDRQLGFHLDQAPLMRLTLIRCAQTEYRLIWTSHHGLFDGRSRVLLLNEVFAFYEAICRGDNLNLSNPPPYRSYIDWLQKQNISKAETFWRTRLKDLNAGQSLAENHRQATPQPAQSYGKKTVRLSKTDTRALRSMVGRYQLTPNTLLQGAWSLLLSRYSGEEVVVFGATRAGRHAAFEGADSVVGLLINTVPVPVHVSPNSRLLPFLQSLRSQWIAMRDYEHTPLVKIHEWSPLSPGQPLFDNLLVFENYQLNALMREQGEQWKARDFHLRGTTHYPLTVAGYLGPHLSLEITYDHQLFDDETIERMLDHLRTLLVEMIHQPNRQLVDIPLLSPTERHQLLCEWNETKTDYPKDECIHELFEIQTEKTPDAIALICDNEQLTYRELNSRANRLAHFLDKLGVGPDMLVGICMERSIEMIVGLLGILKAGGAYVPFDPCYPEERLEFMLGDTHVHIVLTDVIGLASLPATSARVVCLDRDWEAIAKEPEVNSSSRSTADSLAYVIYTSGSTGLPKGVEVRHRGVVRLLFGVDYVQLDRAQTIVQLAPLSFDAATFEVWGALLHGGKCVLFPEKVPSPGELEELLKKYQVTTLWLTAALFNLVINEEPQALSGVKQLLVGGEALSVPHVRKGLAELPGTEIINGYGPTESTTFTCCYRIPRELDEGLSSIPIGRPIGNTQVYILDPYLNPVPIGVAGELHVGGDGLARGYLNLSELTAEKFVKHPFSNDPHARLYKTGDRARYLPDGNIEFLGRIDNQVKLRGYRIELGEIETVLNQNPAIRDAVVTLREDSPGDKRLIAHVVTHQQSSPTNNELKNYLREKLPEYMVPSAFLFLESLPLTPNGKVDRKALPGPDHSRPELDVAFAIPATPVEEILANIWAEILKLDTVGIHDNFFHLGGHSLIATQIVSRINQSFQIDFPLRKLFESPTIAGLAERIDQSLGQQQVPTLLIPAVPRAKDPPLSFAQQRLWFLDQYEPNSSVYNIPSALRLKGSLDIAALEQSLNEIVRRHESLRTTFAAVDGEPLQLIAPALRMSVPITDLTHHSASDREHEAQRLATEQAREPFDLSQGPLLRVLLLCLGQDDHVLVLSMHHIVSDGWSRGVFYHELSMLYQAYTQGNPSPLSELPIQYADFAVWQRQWLQGEVLEDQLSYWKKQLAGAPALLQLPTDRPRPAVQSYRGAVQSIELSQELTQGLQALSARQGVTLFMTLLAVFQTLLYRYTGQNDIVVGSPIANRNRAEIEGLIGFFVNTLVMRTDLSGNPTFKELLTRVRETALGAYTHQDLPFEKLVEELHPQRSLSQSPLVQVLFVMQNTPDIAATLDGLRVVAMPIDAETAKFDLTFSLAESSEGLKGFWKYSTELFDKTTIDTMIGHFHVLLQAIAADPDRRIGELLLLSEEERRRLLVEWNDTARDYPKDKCIHKLFEEQAERSPDAIAVVFEDQRLTYEQLNRQANQLARHLMDLGVGPEVLVGIYLERSQEMAIALLGVLKAGGAYVPLDPSYPNDRLAVMLEDSHLAVVLTDKKYSGRFGHAAMVCLERDRAKIARRNDTNFEAKVSAKNLAYVVYTSGSTGKPKGVAVEHQSLVNYTWEIVRRLKPASNNSFAMVQPLTVDSCITMIFPSLISGSVLHVVSRERALSADELGDYLQRESIDFLKIAPSHLGALQQAGSPPQLMPRRCLIIGGEGSRWEWARSLQTLAPNCTVLNHYGPTETTVGVLIYPMRPADSNQEHPLGTPLGRPIANTQAYVLDGSLRPVPVGVTGELYIGGDSLARGYLNQPKLTRERFIADPFSEDPAARLYKTGDVVRYLSDGNIEFLGRIDDQIKIRGFRVEPAEVEAVLLKHPQVAQAVVAPGDTTEAQTLIAYVVPAADRQPSLSDLRDFVKTKLPEYMVPSNFLLLDALPRTAHGKVDRKSLPPLDRSRRAPEASDVVRRKATEELLASIWTELLNLDEVGIQDNFFDLGGHSLLAMQLISRIRDVFRIELSLRSLFEAPTVVGLARRIELAKQQSSMFKALPITPEAIDNHCPLSFSQERFWFFEQLAPNNSANHLTHGFRLTGPLNIEALERSFAEIVRRHETLRTTFQLRNGKPVQTIAGHWSFRISIADLSKEPPDDLDREIQRLFEAEQRQGFDLTADLMLRATLLRLSLNDHVLFFSRHHIAWDHWCLELFYRELSNLYRAFSNGKPSPLPQLPIQYRHHALWQRKAFEEGEFERHLVYWRRQLSGTPPGLNLPHDYPRKPLGKRRGSRKRLVLPKSLSGGLRALSRERGVTLFMTFLAAFQTLLHRLTGENDIVVGTPVAGRDRSEIEGLIGLFLNTLALRTDFSDDPNFLELLRRVREVALGAYDHQELPFEKLIEELQPQRDLTQTPIFQLFINMYNFNEAGVELDRLTVTPMRPVEQGPQFDIEFFVREHDDGTHCIFLYDLDLFDAATIDRMLGHFQILLEGIVRDPDRRVSELPLLTDAEKHQLLVEWNDTRVDYPKNQCIHQLFEQQVEKTPDTVAVVFDDQQAHLPGSEQRANQLAHYLR